MQANLAVAEVENLCSPQQLGINYDNCPELLRTYNWKDDTLNLIKSLHSAPVHSIFCYGCAEVVPHFPSVGPNLLWIKN